MQSHKAYGETKNLPMRSSDFTKITGRKVTAMKSETSLLSYRAWITPFLAKILYQIC